MAIQTEKLEYLLSSIPEQPGVYLMKDISGDVIYVGKAVNLKNRVTSYFTSLNSHSPKTRRMVANIDSFEYIILDNEKQAFLTESDLIKSIRPKYNVLMKDDKSYPYIKVTLNEKFPGIYVTRNRNDKNARYFGPYPSKVSKKNTVSLLQSVFPIRSCEKMAKRPCIDYDMHLCLAPCTNICDVQKYKEAVDGAVDFLSGNGQAVIQKFKDLMQAASDETDYEKAAYYRDRIDILTAISDRYVLDTSHDSTDAVAYAKIGNYVSFCVISIRRGSISDKRTINFKLDTIEDTDVGYEFLRQFYDTSVPDNIIMYNDILNKQETQKWLSDNAKRKIRISVPKRGPNRKLVETAYENAKDSILLYVGQIENVADTNPVYALASFLKLDTIPDLIEAYDISHISGYDAVASKVVFKEGMPYKSGYRRYSISQENSGSDTDSLKEVMRRRVAKGDMPDLFLIDGGKNQVSAVKQIVKDLIPVAGMVKDDKHKTRALIYKGKEYDLSSDKNLFVFISTIQNEAHRFAISYNRKKRLDKIYESELDMIPGIGDVLKTELLIHFGSVRNIKAASVSHIAEVKGIGEKKAKDIYDYFHKTGKEGE